MQKIVLIYMEMSIVCWRLFFSSGLSTLLQFFDIEVELSLKFHKGCGRGTSRRENKRKFCNKHHITLDNSYILLYTVYSAKGHVAEKKRVPV